MLVEKIYQMHRMQQTFAKGAGRVADEMRMSKTLPVPIPTPIASSNFYSALDTMQKKRTTSLT
jgi:hypothetical protein